MYIETISLADGTYELVQEIEGDIFKAQINTVKLIEAPNSNSEEPQLTDSIDTDTGKPRCIILLFQNMQLIVIIYLCIYVIGVA